MLIALKRLPTTGVTLNLNNASYAGKLIDYEESKIEVYRGNNF